MTGPGRAIGVVVGLGVVLGMAGGEAARGPKPPLPDAEKWANVASKLHLLQLLKALLSKQSLKLPRPSTKTCVPSKKW